MTLDVELEVLHVPGCPNLAPLLDRLARVTDLPVTTREVTTGTDATAAGMAGSPTLLINGHDPFGTGEDRERGLSCRIYLDERGRPVPIPSLDQLRAALAATPRPSQALSARRAAALPREPAQKRVHQAILRSFAATGHAPDTPTLAALTKGSATTVGEVLAALHDLDAVRLAPDGQVVVAYPFSARPTRHRVRIGRHPDAVEVYAMCAVDALGISAMLGADTRIDSVDVTTGRAVSVTTAAGRTSWDPPGAVVFVGADAASGPSANRCCDYINFFTDRANASAWTLSHPHIPGQILSRGEAERLGARVFGQLLTAT